MNTELSLLEVAEQICHKVARNQLNNAQLIAAELRAAIAREEARANASYKVWHCSYGWHGGYGAYQDYECIVIAEIKSKALGMALMEYPDTNPQDWSAQEIPNDKEGVHYVSERCS